MTLKLLSAAVITGFVGSMAAAQTTTFDNQGAAETAFDDLQDDIEDQNERDFDGFGIDGRDLGTYGSVALRYSASAQGGNVDSSDLGIGLRYGSFDGVNSYDVNLAYVYGETDEVKTTDRLLGGVDYRRMFGQSFFGYAQGDFFIDNCADSCFGDGETLADRLNDRQRDVFVGFGVGYRIYNTDQIQWSVQAGPGYRFIDTVGNEEIDEVAASVSSNLFYAFNPNISLTNDTDIIYSEELTTVSNDLAVSVALGNNLSLRTSYQVSFDDKDDDIFEDGSSILGASIVYNFN